MAVPNTFATSTSPIPLANLDANFAYYDAGFSLSGTAVTFAGSITLTTGTANSVPYLNASKVLTTGSAFTFSGTNAVINVTDNTNAALRITQLGTGNALLVEDIANPDASPFLIDSGGVVVKGATQAYASTTGNTPVVQVHGATTSTPNVGYATTNWATAAGGSSFTLAKSRGGVIGTHAITADGDNLGIIYFLGSDGTTFIPAAQITGSVDGTPGTSDMPGRLTFSTTADGASSVSERMRIDSNGDVGIGTTNPLVKLEIAGNSNQTWTVTASITGTTMDVTAVTSGTIAVGDLVFASAVQPYTRVTALVTGTGGIGTYTVSVSQTVLSSTVLGTTQYGSTLIRITDADTAQSQGQPTGALQFYTSDSSAPTAGVGAYVAALAESTTPDTSLVFGTRDNAGGGIDANERMRIDSAGNVGIGAVPTTAAKTNITSTSAGASTIALSLQNASNTINSETVLDFVTNTQGAGVRSAQITAINTNGSTGVNMRFKIGNGAVPTEAMLISSVGNVLVTGTGNGSLGYGTGAGGTVTQLTGKTTDVTLNKPTGQITMFNSALAAGASVIFVLNNSLLAATDSIIVQPNFSTAKTSYITQVTFVDAGQAWIRVTNISAGSLSQAVTLSFAIIKGVTA
jgi:hypothetical protein